jgi:hypothetical protein
MKDPTAIIVTMKVARTAPAFMFGTDTVITVRALINFSAANLFNG